jgi:hypothetical protein
MSERIANLQSAIETMHKCTARFVESVPVIELFRGEVAWDGVVETFELAGHPRAKRCYAWSYVENDEPKYVTVLEIPPVDSAETAVKIAIAAEAKKLNT